MCGIAGYIGKLPPNPGCDYKAGEALKLINKNKKLVSV